MAEAGDTLAEEAAIPVVVVFDLAAVAAVGAAFPAAGSVAGSLAVSGVVPMGDTSDGAMASALV